jgi:hypothetical protein
MASPSRAEQGDDVSVMVIPWCARSSACPGAKRTLLGVQRFSSLRLKPVPDRLRFSAAMTLRGLGGSARVIYHMSKIRKQAANLALRRTPQRTG